ncbi:hypothetical protein [Paenibacillus puerhi]|uniref:hypothetical protein n=1 Tax=Paenibacillus puerhi TaxID=2692622 RepID=UPI001356E06B|nr:hypothetical protein [Paenibacillus puerhi]
MKKTLIGITSGVLFSVATGAIAASPAVQAVLFPSTINIHKGNSTVTLGSNYEVLNYNNSVYIPLRAFSENMGSTVKYTDPTQGTLPQIDVYIPSQPWKLTYLGAGNQSGSPLFVRLFKAQLPQSDSAVGFYANIYNTGQEEVGLKPFKIQIEITNNENNLVWNTEVHSPVPDSVTPVDLIPGANTRLYWGLESPLLIWDKKDMNGVPVPAGQYKVQIKPLIIEYNDNKTQKIEPDMHTLYMIDLS